MPGGERLLSHLYLLIAEISFDVYTICGWDNL